MYIGHDDMVMKDTGIEDRQRALKMVHDHLAHEYNIEMIALREFLQNVGIGFPTITLTQLSLFEQWAKGDISSETALEKLKLMPKETVAYNKMVKKVKSFYDALSSSSRTPHVINKLRTTINRLEDNSVDRYVTYLNTCEKFFEQAVKIDKSQIKIIHGCADYRSSVSNLTFRKMTINQAIRYINFNLKDREQKYVLNKYMVIFQDEYSDQELEKVKTHGGKTKIMDWFLMPESYIELFTDVLGINTFISMGEHKEFYDKIASSLKGLSA